MKFLNKEPREPIWLSTEVPEWQKDYTMEQKLGDIKMMANLELSQVKEVADFHRLDIELRIFSLKEQNIPYEREIFILKRINNHIKEVDMHIQTNARDNSLSWRDLDDESK
jgi:hypothetical protein